MKKTIFSRYRACDEAIYTLFQAIYFIGKQSLSHAKFLTLYKLLQLVKTSITMSMYQDEKACTNLILCISVVIQKNYL